MELKEFITTALVDIIQSVGDARKNLGEHGSGICPLMAPAYATKTKIDYDAHNGQYFQQVEFDVAVSAETKDGASGDAVVKVLGFQASIGAGNDKTNTSISRIKFHVPICLHSNPKC